MLLLLIAIIAWLALALVVLAMCRAAAGADDSEIAAVRSALSRLDVRAAATADREVVVRGRGGRGRGERFAAGS